LKIFKNVKIKKTLKTCLLLFFYKTFVNVYYIYALQYTTPEL